MNHPQNAPAEDHGDESTTVRNIDAPEVGTSVVIGLEKVMAVICAFEAPVRRGDVLICTHDGHLEHQRAVYDHKVSDVEKVSEEPEEPEETVEDELGTAFIPDSSRALMSETGRNSLYYGNTTTNLGLGLTFNLERIELYDSSEDTEDEDVEFEIQNFN